MGWDESRRTMWDMILYNWFRMVRVKHYEQLAGNYLRLTKRYIHVKERLDDMTRDMLAEPYTPTEEERKAMRDIVLGGGFNETADGGD